MKTKAELMYLITPRSCFLTATEYLNIMWIKILPILFIHGSCTINNLEKETTKYKYIFYDYLEMCETRNPRSTSKEDAGD